MLGLPLLPSPDDVAAGAANAFEAIFRGGLADLRRMPATLIDEGPQRSVYRYLPVETAPHAQDTRTPVLLVPPLAAPAICFDLRRGCSLAEHLLQDGRRAYLLDYGDINYGDRNLGLEHWIEDVLPNAVKAVSEDTGGGPVRLVGWCLGGILAALAVAHDKSLPVDGIALIASPFDFSKVPLVAPLRPIAAVTQGRGITALYSLLGGAPAPLVKAGYQLAGIDKYLLKPWTVASNLHRRDLLSQIEAVDAFMSRMHAYPGRTFGQLYHRFFRINDLANGELALTHGRIRLDTLRVPLLVVAGEGDGIAPVAACHHVAGLVPNVPSLRVETAPGGHLGVLTGRAARGSTWVLLDEFLDEESLRAPKRRRARARANGGAAA